jgi:signal transduction histidine kinase
MWRRTVKRLAAGGLAAAVLVAMAGRVLERTRFGATDEAAVARVESELRQRFSAGADTLGTIAARVAAARGLITEAGRDPSTSGPLFDLLDRVLPEDSSNETGVTVYGDAGAPLAWAGRVSEPPRELIEGNQTLRVKPSGLGPGLIWIEPITDRDRSGTPRLGTVVVEQLLTGVRAIPGTADSYRLDTSLVPVSIRQVIGAPSAESLYQFVVPAPGGQLLVEAEVAPADIAAARAKWRRTVWSIVLAVLGVTVLAGAGALIEARRRARATSALTTATAVIVGLLLAGRAILWLATGAASPGRATTSPFELLLTALLLTAVVWLVLDTIERRRVARPRIRLLGATAPLGMVIGVHAAAGAIAAALLWAYSRFLRHVISGTPVDLVHLSSDALTIDSLIVAFALLMLHAAVVWAGIVVLRTAAVYWRLPRTRTIRLAGGASWAAGAAVIVAVISAAGGPQPIGALLVALAAVGLGAVAFGRARGRVRRASQAARLGFLYLAFLVPAVALYPTVHAFATEAKERTIAAALGPQAASQRDVLLSRQLPLTLEQIDAWAALPDFVAPEAAALASATPTTDRAFLVWSRTELATSRLTSAVELYGSDGRLVSSFALNLPEYTTTTYRPVSCDWDLFEEISPFGATERRVLRASRGICDARGVQLGGIVVRVMLDYRALPFLAPARVTVQPTGDGGPSRPVTPEVDFVVYGWSRAPIFTSISRVWPLVDDVFAQMVASREPLWAEVERDGGRYRVYYLNDRFGIYALGYPVTTTFDHMVNIAENVAVSGTLYVLLIGGATLFSALVLHAPASGRALLREVRSSFYRKLWLAFVLAAVVPVVVLAVATRTYFAAQLLAGAEDTALQTATVAQRLVEDYATLQLEGSASLELLDDPVMVLVARAIDQDVDLFGGSRLQATSQRDLFASDVLATRIPGEIYRRIAIDRLPAFVGEENIGGVPYLVAAAPVRAAGREGIVTVPQRLRSQDIQRQIDELDRRVVFASILFVMLGAGLGYWMAERIADPVNRLTRATRRIARGDLDARIAATSSDELRRLVEDFNRMAADLKRQRTELERTQRLEAWADMARQVAHDIKNPLTPIQLSAEHARRVNIDRGRPLSPVLDDCVNAILNQVKLLRQISAEFSSFASSPTPRPEPTDLGALIGEVIAPYRTGLADRIAIEDQLAPDLPAVVVDRTLFSRALTNVLENALHAMPGSGRLTITAARVDDRVVVEVTDTGVGMDQEAAARIFEPYFSTKATGTGLGLTIAKRNIELNGGSIAVTSEKGVGTRVTITLPASA